MNSYRKKLKNEYLGSGIATFFGFFIVAIVIAIFAFLISKGSASFTVHGHTITEFLFSNNWNPGEISDVGTIGANVFIVGSLVISGLALLIATPFAIATAIFINEISPKIGNKVMRPAIELFVGIPSVVYGWIALTVLVPFLAKTFQLPFGFSVLAGSLVLAVMIYPTITSVSTDAMANTPVEYNHASLALGSTRWQYIWRVRLRASMSGILTGVVLGLARAFGEALAVAMVIGGQNKYPKGLLSPTNNLTTVLTTDMGNTIYGSDWNDALWSIALLLLFISLIFIIVIRLIGRGGNKHNA